MFVISAVPRWWRIPLEVVGFMRRAVELPRLIPKQSICHATADQAGQAQDASGLVESPDDGLLGRWTWDEAHEELKSSLCETKL